MKTEHEIRTHWKNLVRSMNSTCDCGKSAHGQECMKRFSSMYAVSEMLAWVLGENPALDPLVEEFARRFQNR